MSQALVFGQESDYNLDDTDFAESKAIWRSVEGEGNLKQVVKTERKPDSKRLSFKSKNFLDRALVFNLRHSLNSSSRA